MIPSVAETPVSGEIARSVAAAGVAVIMVHVSDALPDPLLPARSFTPVASMLSVYVPSMGAMKLLNPVIWKVVGDRCVIFVKLFTRLGPPGFENMIACNPNVVGSIGLENVTLSDGTTVFRGD